MNNQNPIQAAAEQLKEILQIMLGKHDMEYVGDPQESIAVCRFCGEEAVEDSDLFCENKKCIARNARNFLKEISESNNSTEVKITVTCQVCTYEDEEEIDKNQAKHAALEAVTNALEQVENMGYRKIYLLSHSYTKSICVGISGVELSEEVKADEFHYRP